MRSGILFAVLVSIISMSAFGYDWSTNPGDGSEGNPYRISTAEQLMSIGVNPNLLNRHFNLTDNIDLTGYTFGDALIAPQSAADPWPYPTFNGVFNGCGYGIYHLTIHSNGVLPQSLGLFGEIGSPGVVKNLALYNVDVTVTGERAGPIGGLCGINSGSIYRCSVSGNIHQASFMGYVGGICGVNYHYIGHSYSACDLMSSTYCGSICGLNGDDNQMLNGTIENCYSACTVTGDLDLKGGLVGYFGLGALVDCFWDTSVSGLMNEYFHFSARWGLPYVENVAGYTTAEMKQQANFIGWDFVGEDVNGSNNIWRMCVDGVEYPRLSWEFAKNGDFACGDGVDMADLAALAEVWLSAEITNPAEFNYACDANGDGMIGLRDLSVLSQNW